MRFFRSLSKETPTSLLSLFLFLFLFPVLCFSDDIPASIMLQIKSKNSRDRVVALKRSIQMKEKWGEELLCLAFEDESPLVVEEAIAGSVAYGSELITMELIELFHHLKGSIDEKSHYLQCLIIENLNYIGGTKSIQFFQALLKIDDGEFGKMLLSALSTELEEKLLDDLIAYSHKLKSEIREDSNGRELVLIKEIESIANRYRD